jgi:hypothetical protein
MLVLQLAYDTDQNFNHVTTYAAVRYTHYIEVSSGYNHVK